LVIEWDGSPTQSPQFKVSGRPLIARAIEENNAKGSPRGSGNCIAQAYSLATTENAVAHKRNGSGTEPEACSGESRMAGTVTSGLGRRT